MMLMSILLDIFLKFKANNNLESFLQKNGEKQLEGIAL